MASINLATLIAITFIVKYASHKSEWLLYVMCFINGTSSAMHSASLFGLAGVLPFAYNTSILLGLGIDGSIIALLRMLCLGVFGNSA